MRSCSGKGQNSVMSHHIYWHDITINNIIIGSRRQKHSECGQRRDGYRRKQRDGWRRIVIAIANCNCKDCYDGDDTTTTTTTMTAAAAAAAVAVVGTTNGTNVVIDWIFVAVMIMSVNNKKNDNKQLERRAIIAFSTTGSSNRTAKWNSSTVLFQQ